MGALIQDRLVDWPTERRSQRKTQTQTEDLAGIRMRESLEMAV
jgi:hypothetical protein